MNSIFDCPRCGLIVGSMEVHNSDICKKQQEINRINFGSKCNWCGEFSHKDSCPKK